MKRRDLLTMIFPLVGAVLTAPSFISKKLLTSSISVESSMILASYEGQDVVLENGTIVLPSEPQEYDMVFELVIDKKSMPRICGNGHLIEGKDSHFHFENNGKYTIQYLGSFYGWSIT